ncbi:hypothetical protein NAT47_11615 [Flavobacterium sp. HXWNR69]|uniref:Uncharacterized protein n=1 Tax=Flavobacterium fragile TaxID=2949085 RepID=A0ABT0TJS5_9FLAO|nr:hypothetical protein [Flavobacterium sp. HXWNR69]MCL9771063.1 hypothetical protein [Flavobacterium sp. HXWNR69]
MKKIFYLFLSFYLAQSDSFIQKITNDFNSNSNFLVLNIKAKNYNGLAIIENDDLFTYYQITQNKNKQEYKLLTQEILSKKNHIEINENYIEKWGFIKVKESEKIKNKFKKGLNSFIKIYFNDDLIEKGITNEDEKAFIIKILFENKISSYIDDETGLLILNK